MTTQPAPVPEGYVSADMLPPEDAAYVKRLKTALRCGVPGCSCADPGRAHCPSHDNAMVPTLRVTYNPDRGFDFECTRCSWPQVLDALAKRGLMPRSQLYTSTGAVEAGLHPLEFLIQQPPDWLWPNRIPLGKLTLIAGYPSSGKTSIALDIAARVSCGAPAPDQPDALFPSAPVVLAILNGNPKSDVLPVLRLFGADLGRIYLADLITPTLPIDYYPDDPPAEDGPDDPEDEDEDWEEDEDDFADLRDTPLPRRRPVGVRLPARDPFEPPPRAASDSTAPWPSLNKVMKRLANTIEAGRPPSSSSTRWRTSPPCTAPSSQTFWVCSRPSLPAQAQPCSLSPTTPLPTTPAQSPPCSAASPRPPSSSPPPSWSPANAASSYPSGPP